MNYLIPFLILITIVVFIHEYGHYYFAKKYGVGITDFSIGFGKEIFGWNDKSGTRWKICWIPLGGYVKMLGELPGVEIPPEDSSRSLSAKPLWQRVAVVSAGPIFNFLLAFVVYYGMFVGNVTFNDTKVGIVSRGAPAWQAGIRPGDKIKRVDGKEILIWEDLREAIGPHFDKSIHLLTVSI